MTIKSANVLSSIFEAGGVMGLMIGSGLFAIGTTTNKEIWLTKKGKVRIKPTDLAVAGATLTLTSATLLGVGIGVENRAAKSEIINSIADGSMEVKKIGDKIKITTVSKF